jgi:holin-like protein
MLKAFVLVISLLIIGDVLVAITGLPVPGAVLGLLLLAGLHAARSHETANVSALFDAIIPFAPMLFVPAAVGVVANLDVIASAFLPIVSAVTFSTLAALLVTGHVFQRLLGRSPNLSAGKS